MDHPMDEIDFDIREARKEDMQHIHDLIKELAEFEHMENQVQITAEQLIADGCSENPAFRCFVASKTETNEIIGYALYYNCYSTWLGKSIFLEDIYVQPEYRSQGIGKRLFVKVAEIAHNTNQRMDFHVLSWNPATEFYKSMGCINLTEVEEWQLYRLNSDGLDKIFDIPE